jgi:aspartyl-tRNA(Asn)/glutamyl-tRNA(Gln) amidotransferase subunit B
MKLRTILQYLGVSTGNMEEGSFRCDANVSIRPRGTTELLAKVEVKNMNSFKAVYKALEYEAKRQEQVLTTGGKLVQETRGWVEEKGVTVSQRSKEYAHDYRYFPEPDLPPFVFKRDWVEQLRSSLLELPDAKRDKFMMQYGLPLYDANILVESKAMAAYFEDCIKIISSNTGQADINKKAKKVSNWILGDFSKLLNATNTGIEVAKITPQNLVELLNFIDNGIISGPISKVIFEEMFHNGKMAKDIIAEKGLQQISDNSELEDIITTTINSNNQAVIDFKAGKQQSLGFLIGQVMKASKGRANPELVKSILLQKLGGA